MFIKSLLRGRLTRVDGAARSWLLKTERNLSQVRNCLEGFTKTLLQGCPPPFMDHGDLMADCDIFIPLASSG